MSWLVGRETISKGTRAACGLTVPVNSGCRSGLQVTTGAGDKIQTMKIASCTKIDGEQRTGQEKCELEVPQAAPRR